MADVDGLGGRRLYGRREDWQRSEDIRRLPCGIAISYVLQYEAASEDNHPIRGSPFRRGGSVHVIEIEHHGTGAALWAPNTSLRNRRYLHDRAKFPILRRLKRRSASALMYLEKTAVCAGCPRALQAAGPLNP